VLETDRLILRKFDVSDYDALGTILGDTVVMESSVDGPLSEHQIKMWLEHQLEVYKLDNGFGVLAVVERVTTKLIGYCGLFYFPNIDGNSEIEIGYRFSQNSWGSGYATEAACVVRNYAFASLNVQRLIALIEPVNTRSIRVAEKLGMVFEKKVLLENYDYPDYLYLIENPDNKN